TGTSTWRFPSSVSTRWSATSPRCSRSRPGWRSRSRSAATGGGARGGSAREGAPAGTRAGGRNPPERAAPPRAPRAATNTRADPTPTYLGYAVEHIADRAAAYGFDGVVVDGTDVLAVYREAKRAIERAREGGGPTLLECLTLRMEGHAVHDDAFYVPKEMFEQ